MTIEVDLFGTETNSINTCRYGSVSARGEEHLFQIACPALARLTDKRLTDGEDAALRFKTIILRARKAGHARLHALAKVEAAQRA